MTCQPLLAGGSVLVGIIGFLLQLVIAPIGAVVIWIGLGGFALTFFMFVGVLVWEVIKESF